MLKLLYMLVSFIFLKHIILLQYQANALTSSEVITNNLIVLFILYLALCKIGCRNVEAF